MWALHCYAKEFLPLYLYSNKNDTVRTVNFRYIFFSCRREGSVSSPKESVCWRVVKFGLDLQRSEVEACFPVVMGLRTRDALVSVRNGLPHTADLTYRQAFQPTCRVVCVRCCVLPSDKHSCFHRRCACQNGGSVN